MDFFRKYQRVILYTAGIFALVTFSISAPVLGFFDSLFRKQVETPTMKIGDRIVKITMADEQIASQLVLRDRFDPAVVMPPIVGGDPDDDRRTIYAALRRLAIEYGIEPSEDEVDRAIQQTIEVTPNISSVSELAMVSRRSSVADYRLILGEALRIATFVRLQALSADASDASLIDQILRNQELITLEVATLDEEKLQEELETEDVTDEQLQEWIGGLEESDRIARGYTLTGRYRVQFAYVEVDEFDPTAFAEEIGDTEFSEEQVELYYNMNRPTLFLKPTDGNEEENGEKGDQPQENKEANPEEQKDQLPDEDADPDAQQAEDTEQDPYLPLDDTLKAEIRKRLQAEAVLRKLWDQVTAQYEDWITAEKQAVEAASLTIDEEQVARDEAAVRGEAEDATDEEKAALEAADAALEEARAALATAEEALAEKREAFDAAAAFDALAAGRAGVGVVDSGEELKSPEELSELEPIGPWTGSVAVLSEERPLSTQIQKSKDAVFEMRLVAIERNPLKPFEDIREKARADYFQQKATDIAVERADAFEETLKELAKERVRDKIADLEKERDQKLEERMTEWREKLESDLATARDRLAEFEGSDPERRVYIAAKARVEHLEKQLADVDQKRAEVLEELQAETDEKIDELAKENYGAVLQEAASQHGFEVAEYGPYPRDLASRGGPKERFPKPVQYLFWSGPSRDLEEGEATDLLEDFSGRARHLAVAKKVQQATISDLTRRQLLQARSTQGPMRRLEGTLQSFTLEALKERYGYQAPGDATIEPKD